MEIIFSGTKRSPDALIKTAVEENADILGISCLPGAHMKIAEDILALKRQQRLSSLKLILGGTIPETDRRRLIDIGIDFVVSSGATTLDRIVRQIVSLTASSC
jgi:methylmalonyl-CoA mutase cobalamin-binding domain/chain